MKCLLLLAACAVATGVMTSCLNSDDDEFDSKLTAEELSTYLTRLNGTYSGKLLYYRRGLDRNERDSMILDSVDHVSWAIRRDSTIIINDFPDSIYNNAITGNADLRKVLATAPSKTLTCTYTPYKGRTQDNTVDYGFYVIPKGTIKSNYMSSAMYTETQITDEDGKQYEVNYGYVYIDENRYYQANGYLSSSNYMDFMLVMTDIKCPGEYFMTQVFPVLLKGQKMY